MDLPEASGNQYNGKPTASQVFYNPQAASFPEAIYWLGCSTPRGRFGERELASRQFLEVIRNHLHLNCSRALKIVLFSLEHARQSSAFQGKCQLSLAVEIRRAGCFLSFCAARVVTSIQTDDYRQLLYSKHDNSRASARVTKPRAMIIADCNEVHTHFGNEAVFFDILLEPGPRCWALPFAHNRISQPAIRWPEQLKKAKCLIPSRPIRRK